MAAKKQSLTEFIRSIRNALAKFGSFRLEKEKAKRMTRLPMHQPQLLLDELGDGRLIVGGEETNEVNSVGQAVDIDGIPL